MSDIAENTPEFAKRSPGRPPRAEAAEPVVKKGKPTWKPANVIEVKPRTGFTPRMINKDPQNLVRKQNEGWEIESGLNNSAPSTTTGYGRINEGKSLTSVMEGHDYVIGWLPNEQVEARREYYQSKTDRMTQALIRQTQKEMKDAARGVRGGSPEVHGSITIEKRGVRTVIDD